jgi:hypothetical protein
MLNLPIRRTTSLVTRFHLCFADRDFERLRRRRYVDVLDYGATDRDLAACCDGAAAADGATNGVPCRLYSLNVRLRGDDHDGCSR